MKVVVFDLGGTLMEYSGMPLLWVDFYQQGFEAINIKYRCEVSEQKIAKAVEVLKSFNPRISLREVEYAPEFIFTKALEGWKMDAPMLECVHTFYAGLDLKALVYKDTIPGLQILREKGYTTATLTDLPNAMPDALFKKDIPEVLQYIDFYVSSQSCGYRKPNSRGLQVTAEKYGIPMKELIFVGDEEKDRRTADNAGCQFIHIDRKGNGADSIRNLYELVDCLEFK